MASLLRRIRTKADALAAGTDEPAGLEPDEPLVRRPNARERGRMRRRLRKLVRIRDAKLRELGGLVLEMQRLGRENPALLKQRAAELQAIDDEARGLASALGEEKDLEQVLAAGITGACTQCGTLMSTSDRFCSRCGAPAGQTRTPHTPDAPATTGNGSHAPVTEELQHS